jgi:hypothetical protein
VCRRNARGRHSMLLQGLGVAMSGTALALAIVFQAGPDITSMLTGTLAWAISRVRVPRLGNPDPPRHCPCACSRERCGTLPISGNGG